jgi:hypothetical protein
MLAMQKHPVRRVTIYAMVMVAAAVVDVLLVVWLFTRVEPRWGIMFLLLGAWMIPVVAHVVGQAFSGSPSVVHRPGQVRRAMDWVDPDLPWGRGWVDGTVLGSAEGVFNTGLLGLSLFLPVDEEAPFQEGLRIPWERVEWAEFASHSRVMASAHPQLADQGMDGAVVGRFRDPPGAGSEAQTFVVLLSDDCPRAAWEHLFVHAGVHVRIEDDSSEP